MDASKSHPYKSTAKRPDDEEQLEAKVEQHAWSGDVLLRQIRIPSAIYAPVAAVNDFRTRSPSQCLIYRLIVDRCSTTPGTNPETDNCKNCRGDNTTNDDCRPIVEVALSIIVM